MKTRLFIALTAALLIICFALSACGEDKPAATETPTAQQSSDASAETTEVLETTADGGTVERDSEGNRITKDSDGGIVSVEDKSGASVDVNDYVASHPGTVPSLTGNTQSGSSGDTSETQEEVVEGEIPVIIATIPDDDDLIELPEDI